MKSYEIQNQRLYSINDDGERVQLANFTAEIIEEVHYLDGMTKETQLVISGKQLDRDGNEVELPPVQIPATDYAGLGWVMPNWGIRCVISPGGSIKEDLRTAIQLQSSPKITKIYKHTGWTDTDQGPAYIHAGGAVTAKGDKTGIKVQLPNELSRYNLSTDATTKQGVQATLQLADLGPPEVMWPLIAATLAPILGPVDFGIHVSGRTGTFKSEVGSLLQSHYGSEMDARHLPGSWSSTANALEAQAFFAKNAVFLVDDFVPSGTSWQVRSYQQTADKIIRSQGNQSGRARLTDTSNLQSTMYPRGLILSTGEDTPEGHSVRARMLILELSPGDIDTKKLTAAQQNRGKFPATTKGFAQWVAQKGLDNTGVKQLTEEVRNSCLDTGHTRTPSMIGRLVATMRIVTQWLLESKLITQATATKIATQSEAAIMASAEQQSSYLETADPVDLFLGALRHVLGAGLGHFRTANGGVPKNPGLLGWSVENDQSDIPTFRSRGPCIGWVIWNQDELLLDLTAGYNLVRKAAGSEVALTKTTLMKRLKDSGKLKRTDDTRQRNSVRVTAEGHPRQVIAMPILDVLDLQALPDDEE